MIYLRNNTAVDQWLEDPQTGIRRRIEPAALARVSDAVADHMLKAAPTTWVRVVAIALAPPGRVDGGEQP